MKLHQAVSSDQAIGWRFCRETEPTSARSHPLTAMNTTPILPGLSPVAWRQPLLDMTGALASAEAQSQKPICFSHCLYRARTGRTAL
jgi:hypothetical protein